METAREWETGDSTRSPVFLRRFFPRIARFPRYNEGGRLTAGKGFGMDRARVTGAWGGVLCISSLCAGGGAPLQYVNETATRLVAAPELGVADIEEKDYAWGDIDNDGDTDLVVVRKQPFTTPGKRPNVLLMNENGVLTDRTAEFAATAINLPKGVTDDGFMTPTNDRDVILIDVNRDGWLDIVTAATFGDADPKHISHPRVYMNQGNDKLGRWQGFVFDNARIPQLLSNPTCVGCRPHAASPRFNAVAAGDVTNDSMPELYFGDHDGMGGISETPADDLNNKLLLNDGGGHFSDVTSAAITGTIVISQGTYPFWQTFFGAAVGIADMNMDGLNDLISQAHVLAPQYVGIAYNSPIAPSVFATSAQSVFTPSSAVVYISVADLNNDGRLDLIATDDNTDRYRLATGISPGGQAVFGSTIGFSGTGGFGGGNLAADLDADGFHDVLISDVDFIIGPCPTGRIADILLNDANPPNVTFTPDAGGIPAAMRDGVYDFAVFDVNNDGWLDIIIGRCPGIDIWIFDPPDSPADLNGDGIVNGIDLGILLANWSIPAGSPGCGGAPGVCASDINGDGVVDGIDLGMLLGAWS